jgi:biotin carboxylase
MKKILLLGGSAQQVAAILKAKQLGLYTVLCDYLPDNPGQYYADAFYMVSTTDKKGVLEVAEKEQINGILAYASDPAAPTAAYIAEVMGLPGSPFKSVDILCNKDKYRKFLSDHDFFTPVAKGYSDSRDALSDIERNMFKLPIIVKPVDSSGSKGVDQIDTKEEAESKLSYAMSFSKNKRIILEDYVEKYGYQVAGDGLSINGELVFTCFGNDHFDSKCASRFVPMSASFPYVMPKEIHLRIQKEIQRLITLLNMGTATYNFDIRIDKNYNVYLMEIGPRDGGNYIPDVIKYATGVDLIECSIKAAMGEEIRIPKEQGFNGFWSYYAVHSYYDGILDHIDINEDVIKENIVENYIQKKPGDLISAFTGSNTSLGILLMKFSSMDEMLYMMDNSEKWIKVVLR